MNKLFFCIGIILVCIFQAQALQIDSLQNRLRFAKEDTNKVIMFNNLCWDLINAGKYDTAFQYVQDSKKLSTSLKYNIGTAGAYNNEGVIYWMKGEYDRALQIFFTALDLYKEAKHQLGVARCYNNISLVYFNMGRYPEALKNSLASLKIAESLGRKKSIISSYNNIAAVYEAQGNNTEALKSYNSALYLSKQIDDKQGIAKAYLGAGNIYHNLGKYNEALKYHFESLKVFEEAGDKISMADAYNNIGNVYSLQAQKAGDAGQRIQLYQQALQNYFSSLRLREALDNREGIATSLANIGATYEDLQKHREAEDYAIRALRLAGEVGALERIKESHETLSKVYSSMGRHKEAFENFKAFIAARDSLVNEENTRKTVQMEMQYEFHKKEEAARLIQERKDALAAAERKKQNIILFAISAFGLLVFGFAVFAYRSYLQKQKANIEISQQKRLIEEKQKEILDSIYYARRIQRSLLTSERYIRKNLERLIRC